MIQFTNPINQSVISKEVPLVKSNFDGSLSYPFFEHWLPDFRKEETFHDLEQIVTDLFCCETGNWDEKYPSTKREETLFFPILSIIREMLLQISKDPNIVKLLYETFSKESSDCSDSQEISSVPESITDIRFLDYKCRRIDYSTLVITFNTGQKIHLKIHLAGKNAASQSLVFTWK